MENKDLQRVDYLLGGKLLNESVMSESKMVTLTRDIMGREPHTHHKLIYKKGTKVKVTPASNLPDYKEEKLFWVDDPKEPEGGAGTLLTPEDFSELNEASPFLEGATTFKLTINMEDDAFVENPGEEVARILRDVADRIEGHPHFSKGHSQPIRDVNGNTVGGFDVV